MLIALESKRILTMDSRLTSALEVVRQNPVTRTRIKSVANSNKRLLGVPSKNSSHVNHDGQPKYKWASFFAFRH